MSLCFLDGSVVRVQEKLRLLKATSRSEVEKTPIWMISKE